MEKRWVLKPGPREKFKKKFSAYSDFLQAMFYQRGIKTKKEAELFFNQEYEKGLNDPLLLSGMRGAVKRILLAIKKKEKVAVYGDYDADGVTAASIIYQFFLELGIKPLVYIPDRVKEGYGLNAGAVQYFHTKKIQLVITVDTGVRNITEVASFTKEGIDVIITDHHTLPPKLPQAVAIVNPHLDEGVYPTTELSGAGVAFKLVQALIKKIGKQKFSPGFEKWLLDYVAIGTIADVVPLLGENRNLVRFGLIVISKTRRLGLKALLENAGISLRGKVDSRQVAFRIAPRINAAGRMDHANNAFILLNEERSREAEKIAAQLEKQNSKRQTVTEKIIKKIISQDLTAKKIIIAKGKDYPLGIVGLVAGRLCERYCRPALVISSFAGKLRGSARSIPEFNIIKALEKLSPLLEEYGGHKQAAGFTLKPGHYRSFQEKLSRLAEKEIGGKNLAQKIKIDYALEGEAINDALIKEIKQLEPLGCGNLEPVFKLTGVKITAARFVGKDAKHYKITVSWNGKDGSTLKYFNGIWFNPEKEKAQALTEGCLVDIAFNLDINYFNGREEIELKIIDIKKGKLEKDE